MAEAYDVAMAPHCPLGPVALASCVQVDACSPNALIQELSIDIRYNETTDVLDYLADPSVFDYEDGFVTGPRTPASESRLTRRPPPRESQHEVDWHNPIWRHPDGSVAEW